MKILVVDDDILFLRSSELVIRLLDHEPYTAPNGDEGLAQLLKVLPQMVLLDRNMPGKSGYEFSRIVRTDPSYQGVREVILIGTGDFLKGETELLDELMPKPYNIETLEGYITKYMNK